LKRKSKSNIKSSNRGEQQSTINNFDINSYLSGMNTSKNEKSAKKSLKYDIDAIFNGTPSETTNLKSNKSVNSYLSSNKSIKSRTINLDNMLIDFSSNVRDKTISTSYLNTTSNFSTKSTPKSKIFREINSLSYGYKGAEKTFTSNRFDDTNKRNNIKNDIDYYLTYLSPTKKRTSFLKNNFNTLDQHHESNNLMKLLFTKKEKSNKSNQHNEFDSFTRDFSSHNNNKNSKQSLFQQKINSLQSKQSYLK